MGISVVYTSEIKCSRCGNGLCVDHNNSQECLSLKELIETAISEGWEIKKNKACKTTDLICDDCLNDPCSF